MRTPIIALAVLTLVFSTTERVLSTEKDEGKDDRSKWRGKLLKQYDKNEDGKLDDEERKAMRKAWGKKWKHRKGEWNKIRKQYDKDGDGKLNHDERNALRKAMAEKWRKHGKFDLAGRLMARMDEDKDGKISADEVHEKFRRYFKNVDADADGTVNKKEINQAVKKAKIKFISHVQNRVFDKIDRNDDGKLDIDKIVAKIQKGLNKADTSGDGFIDKAEFKAIISPTPTAKDSSSEQRDQVEAELARLRRAIEKLTESLKDRE